jgi:hypothetical protein
MAAIQNPRHTNKNAIAFFLKSNVLCASKQKCTSIPTEH